VAIPGAWPDAGGVLDAAPEEDDNVELEVEEDDGDEDGDDEDALLEWIEDVDANVRRLEAIAAWRETRSLALRWIRVEVNSLRETGIVFNQRSPVF
jgi:hypothetical protein